MFEMSITLITAFTITFGGSMYLLNCDLPSRHSSFYLFVLLMIFSYVGWITSAGQSFGSFWFHTGLVILISCLLIGLTSLLWWVRGLMVE